MFDLLKNMVLAKTMKSSINILLAVFIIINVSEIKAQKVIDSSSWIKISGGMDFPEGPAIDQKGNLFVSNCYGGWIARYDGTSMDTFLVRSEKANSIDKTNGLVIIDNEIYACDYGLGAILRINMEGVIERVADNYNGERFNRPNDIIFDGSDNILFTDPKGYGKDIEDGRVFQLSTVTGELKLVGEGLAFPNGINISPLDGKIYTCESAKESIYRFSTDSGGRFINKEIFAHLPGGDPDGIEFDNEGNLYVAHFGGQAVYIISPEGKILARIQTPGKKPTNLEFADERKKNLFLTEAETNSVYYIDLEEYWDTLK